MRKINWFPALASIFIVGLGQIIKGQGNKGLKLLLLFYFILPICAYVALLINGQLFIFVAGITFLLSLITWLYSVVDAGKKHEKII